MRGSRLRAVRASPALVTNLPAQLWMGSYQLPVEEICDFYGSRCLLCANNMHAERAAAMRRLIPWRAGAVQLKPQHVPLPVTLPFRLAM